MSRKKRSEDCSSPDLLNPPNHPGRLPQLRSPVGDRLLDPALREEQTSEPQRDTEVVRGIDGGLEAGIEAPGEDQAVLGTVPASLDGDVDRIGRFGHNGDVTCVVNNKRCGARVPCGTGSIK